ncbi:hypothetical protein ACFQX6_32105 [Streptosporangium lutulentum]
MKPGPLADRVALMRPQVNDSMATLERLAEQASLTGTALAGFDLDKLKHEHAQLTRARKKAKEELLQDLDRALASLSSQRAVADRLSGTRERVLARMESSTISIEELLARVVELSAMSATGALEPTGALDELADALEGSARACTKPNRSRATHWIDKEPPCSPSSVVPGATWSSPCPAG